MLMAMVFHFAWDDMGGLGGGGALVAVLPFVIAAVELTPCSTSCGTPPGRSASWTRDLLGPEVEAGVLDPPLLDAVSGLRKERKAYRKHVRGRRAARHRTAAASDLAREIARAGGRETDRVAHARAEVVRLHQRG